MIRKAFMTFTLAAAVLCGSFASVGATGVFEEIPDMEMPEPSLAADESFSSVFEEITPFEGTEEVFSTVDQTVWELKLRDLLLPLPKEWENAVELLTEGTVTWFVHGTSRKEGATGKLFGISMYESYREEKDGELPLIRIGGCTYVWVSAPEENRFTENSREEYEYLASFLDEICGELSDTESVFEEVTEDLPDEMSKLSLAVFEEETEDSPEFAAEREEESLLLEALAAVPSYYEQYYTAESAAALTSVLEEIRSVNTETETSERLTELTERLNAAVAALVYKTAEVPQIYITTDNENGNTLTKGDGYVPTKIALVDSSGSVIEDSTGLIKIRGNSTAYADKKPYTIKFSSKKNVLGMGKAKKWALIANYFDPSMLRNYTAFEMAHMLGIPYSSEQAFTEVWVDGVFKGCFLLMEPVEVGSTRTDIDLNAGDFMIEFERDRVEADTTYLVTKNGMRFTLSEPEVPTDEQAAACLNILDSIVDVLETGDINAVSEVIDLDSFVNYYLLNEWIKTTDFGFSSVFFYYKQGKLYAGPPWDFDLSSGNIATDTLGGRYSVGLHAIYFHWYELLAKMPEFHQLVAARYEEMVPIFRSVYENGGIIDQALSLYGNVFKRDETEAGWDWNTPHTSDTVVPFATYEENLAYYRQWLKERTEWLYEFLVEKNGWIFYKGSLYHYREDGSYDTGWQTIDGKQYYFNENGVLQKGTQVIDGEEIFLEVDEEELKEKQWEVGLQWQTIDGKTYYMTEEGPLKGWQTIDGAVYYFDEEGAMLKGLQKIDGLYYYLDPVNGWRWLNWRNIENYWHYFDQKTGASLTGWQKLGSCWYYFTTPRGEMLTGVQKIDGKYYYLKPNGAKSEGFIRYDDDLYYFAGTNGTAISGWIKKDNNWYYFGNEDCRALSGVHRLANCWYYFDPVTKVMQTGWQIVDGKKCYFRENGARVNGWILLDGNWYYTGPDNEGALYGMQKIGNCWYYLRPEDGAMLTGLQRIDGTVYYFRSNGVRAGGFLSFDGVKYYFSMTTGARQYGWLLLDGVWYYLDPALDGAVVTGMRKIGNCWYYFDPETGVMQIGFLSLGDKTYYFRSNGARVGGIRQINGDRYWFQMSTGELMKGWKFEDGTWYYFTPAAASGFTVIGSNTYYFDPVTNGMKTGLQMIDGNVYYFKNGGQMVTGTILIDGEEMTFGEDGKRIF